MSFDGSARGQRKVNLSSLGKSGSARSSPAEDRTKANEFVEKLKNERIARQAERRAAEAGEKLTKWLRRRLAAKRLLDSMRAELLRDIHASDGSAPILVDHIRKFFFFMLGDMHKEYASAAALRRHQNATSAMLALIRQLRESFTKSLDLVSLMLPKQNKPEEEKARDLRVLISTFAATCLVATQQAGLSEISAMTISLLQVISDSSSWLFHTKVPVPVIQQSLARLSRDLIQLHSLRTAPSFIYLNLFKLSLFAPSENKYAPSIGETSLMLLFKSMDSETRGPEANLAIGAQLLGDLLNSGVIFRNMPPAYLRLVKDYSSLLLSAILPCIDVGMFVRKDGPDEIRDDVSDDEDPMAVNLEPQLYIVANIVDILNVGGRVSETLKFETYKAIGILIRSIGIYKDVHELSPVLPQLQSLWSASTIMQVFHPLFTFPSNSNDPSQVWGQLQELYLACDLYMGVLIKFPGQYTRVMSSIALGSGRKVIMCLWNWFKTHQILGQFENKGRGLDHRLVELMWLFLSAYSHLLFIIDDEEFHETQIPLHMTEVVELIRILKRYVFNVHSEQALAPLSPDEMHLTRVASRLLSQLRERDLRRPISKSVSNLWEMSELQNLDDDSLADPRVQQVLALLPFASSFQTRYLLFRGIMSDDMRSYRSDWGGLSKLKIRRDHLIEDGYDAFIRMSPETLKSHVRVKFVDAHGVAEEGIDGGGLFKEFLTDLIKETFKPSYGLFLEGEDRRLCPNPGALKLFLDFDPLGMYRFLGRVLGKAVYEGVIVDLNFAPFFLKKLLGKSTTIDDLATFDPQFYKNLISLKHSDDVESLCLTFSFPQTFYGETTVHKFIPNGDSVAVTNANVNEYIHYVADFKLNKQFSKQCAAFVIGFQEVIPPRLLSLFDATELNILIAGDTVTVDVDDMEKHAIYSDYTPHDATIRHFWKVMRELSSADLQLFLKFVTSCPRPPMLGFKHLNPPLRIGRSDADTSRLPSASTCFNMLKLPPYSSASLLKEKLVFALRNMPGFGLS